MSVIGSGSSLGDGGQATSGSLFGPVQVTVDTTGVVYFCDQGKS